MRVAVVSDLHIRDGSSSLAQTFTSLLESFTARESIDELWLLGDIYDLMVGPYEFWEREHTAAFAALRKITARGARVRWCEGNHDFHLARVLNGLGIEVFDEEKRLSLGGKRIFLAHGDLVNENDTKYLEWRALTRARWFRRGLDAVPAFVAERTLLPLAKALSRKSRGRERDDPIEVRERYRAYARVKFDEGFDAVFLGHCHVEDLLVEQGRFYCNLGSGLGGTLRYALWNVETEAFPKVEIHSKI